MEEDNKFSEAELLVGGFFTLGIDGLCALIDLTGIGLFISPLIQSAATFAVSMWLQSKGGSLSFGKEAVKYASSTLPILPTTFIVFLVSAFVHNHPKAIESAAILAGPAGKLTKIGKIAKKAA